MLLEETKVNSKFLKVIQKYEGIKELYPPQEHAINSGILEGKNLILATPTASGKTLVAELAMAKILEKNQKAVYVVPLRSLAYEKFLDFKKYEKLGYQVRLEMGNLDSRKYSSHLKFDILVTTAEKLDSILRSKTKWLKEVGILIMDEIHLISTERGPVYEIIIAKFKSLFPKIQILALSATIGNTGEIAEWLKAGLVESEWRPVKLVEESLVGRKFEHLKEIVEKEISQGGQILIFVNSRRSSEALAEKLGEGLNLGRERKNLAKLEKISREIFSALSTPTRQCKRLSTVVKNGIAFHHAGIVNKQKILVEDSFKKGLIKVIVATPTLAFGVNLPSRTVIIRDIKRYTHSGYYDYIPVLEYKQMCLPYSTKILMDDGSLNEIGDLVENRLKKKVISFDPKNRKVTRRKISGYFRRKSNKLIEINCSNFRLKVTPEHPVLTKKGWIKAINLSKGDEIAYLVSFLYKPKENIHFYKFLPVEGTYVKNKTDLFQKIKGKFTRAELAEKLGKKLKDVNEYVRGKKAIPLSVILSVAKMLTLSDDEIASRIKYVKTTYGNVIKIPLFINEDFMWLLGMVASDGNIVETRDKRTGSFYHKIRISNTNKEIMSRCKRILNELNLYPKIIHKEQIMEIEFASSLLAKVMKEFGIPFKDKTHQLEVSNAIFGFPPNLINAYLMGVFDGDGNYCETKTKNKSIVRRVLIATASKKFAYDLHNLLLRLGIFSYIKKKAPTSTKIRGEEARFISPLYEVIFRQIRDIQRFTRYAKPTKCKIPRVEYSNYHNIGQYHQNQDQIKWLRIDKIKERSGDFNVYNISIDKTNTYIAENFVLHNCGRAGRPKYDSFGKALLLANDEDEKSFLEEKYIKGEIEKINSQLGLEPILRFHILAAVASQFSRSKEALITFLKKTFFSYQYGFFGFEEKIENILEQLEEWDFIKRENSFLLPTNLGLRISELYLDPQTAFNYLSLLRIAEKEKKFSSLGFLEMLCDAVEMPLLRVKRKEEPLLWEKASELKEKFLRNLDSFELDYHFLERFKTSLLFISWLNEISEDLILKQYQVPPGILNQKIQIAEWLAYSASELAKICQFKKAEKELRKLEFRIKYGVKEELIPLVLIKGVGRVRARKLFNAGLKKPSEVKKASLPKLWRLLGKKVAEKVRREIS